MLQFGSSEHVASSIASSSILPKEDSRSMVMFIASGIDVELVMVFLDKVAFVFQMS